MDSVQVEEVTHGSPLYWETVDLRSRVLRAPLGLSFSEQELRAEKDSIHLGLLRQGKLVACLILVEEPGGGARMRQVAVDFGCQGQGFGRCLVNASEAVCRARKLTEISLHARANAVKFYERMGYESEGAPFIEVGLPHLSMRKRLSQ